MNYISHPASKHLDHMSRYLFINEWDLEESLIENLSVFLAVFSEDKSAEVWVVDEAIDVNLGIKGTGDIYRWDTATSCHVPTSLVMSIISCSPGFSPRAFIASRASWKKRRIRRLILKEETFATTQNFVAPT